MAGYGPELSVLKKLTDLVVLSHQLLMLRAHVLLFAGLELAVPLHCVIAQVVELEGALAGRD